MSVTTAIAIYFIIWWVVLFAVLPFGVRSQQESGAVAPGTDPGAPAVPQLMRKLTSVCGYSRRALITRANRGDRAGAGRWRFRTGSASSIRPPPQSRPALLDRRRPKK